MQGANAEFKVGETSRRWSQRLSSAQWPAQILMNTDHRSSKWARLKKRLRRRGLVDVDVDHHRFKTLQRFRAGVRDIMMSFPRIEPQVELVPDDYTQVRKRTIKGPDGKMFEFTSFAPDVFSAIRQAIGVSEDAYLKSLAPESTDAGFLEFLSNSKGGQELYITPDKRHFLKTEKPHYVREFIGMLGDYLDHFLAFPHSLLVKFLGVHALQVKGQGKMYFMVMQSIFYPDERIQARYDLKGCLAGRYTKPKYPEAEASTILKDSNFNGQQIDLGDQRTWFFRQLELDLAFLRNQGVIDYSLLVAMHKLHPLDRRSDIGELVARVTKSMVPSDGRRRSSEPIVDGCQVNPMPGSPELRQDPSNLSVRVRFSSRRIEPLLEPPKAEPDLGKYPIRKLISLVDPSNEGQTAVLENRRLLPNCRNALHIIDGTEMRYYLGIIDFLTKYRCRQKTGRILKGIRFCCGDHSTVPPQAYAARLLRFAVEHTS